MGSAWLTRTEYTLTAPMPALHQVLLAATSSATVRSRIYSGKPAPARLSDLRRTSR